MYQKQFFEFRAGDFLLDDFPRSGRPVEADSYQIKTLIENNQRHIKVGRANISKTSTSSVEIICTSLVTLITLMSGFHIN